MRIVNCIYKHNTKWYFLGAALLMLVGIILIFTQYFGAITLADDKALDMLFNYDKATFYNILHLLDESDRLAYKLIHLADYIFILGVYPLISIGFSRLIRKDHKIRILVLLPLVAGLFDFLENLMMDIHLYAYPSEIQFLGSLAGIFTTIKFICLYASIILIAIFGVLRILKLNKKG